MATQTSTIGLSERSIYRLNLAGRHHTFVVATVEDVAEDGVYAFLTTLADFGNGLGCSYAMLSDGRVIEYPAVAEPVVVATDGALFDTNKTAEYVDPNVGVSGRVIERLGLNDDMLNSLYAAGPVGGYDGLTVAAEIREQFGIRNASEPLGMQLAEIGVLSEDEAEYLDDSE